VPMAIKIGFTYDLKDDHRLADGMPEDALAELDKEETVAEIEEAIRSGGFLVERIGSARRLLERLPGLDVDIVFNTCEGVGTRNRESEVPVILDLYGVPYVGSDGLTLGVTLDKVMAKKAFVADGVPTPRYFLADAKTDLSNHSAMKFPFIVKPRHEGSSKGISEESIVTDKKQLKVQVDRVSRSYRQPALVEEFVAGSEFTVLVIGNDRPQALAPVQIEILGKLDLGNLVYTSRRLSNTDIRYICPSPISKSLDRELRDTAVRAYQAVDCRDFGRVDFRVDRKGNIFTLEVNPLPALSTEDVFSLIAQAEGMTHEQLIVRIVEIALARCGIKKGRGK